MLFEAIAILLGGITLVTIIAFVCFPLLIIIAICYIVVLIGETINGR